MCGILGGNNARWNYQAALDVIMHRGPDGNKISKIKNFTMGFVRLAIVDLNESAMQPMISVDGKYVITFNGEIYDYKQIRKNLEKLGYIFKTQSDTEVLLYAFIEWKEKVTDYIEGIFAFSIYDIENELVYLFRDRVGVKPLYYYVNGNDFAFSSELKAIEKLLNKSLDIDKTALYDYFNYLCIPEPKTIYKKVRRLEPGSFLIYSIKNNRIVKNERYWMPIANPYEGDVLSEDSLKEKISTLRTLINNSIRKQLVADVPVGSFFSGGIDSSIVTVAAKSYKSDILSYGIAFTDERYDESKYIKRIGNHIGANYKIEYFEQEDFQKLKRMLISSFDEPFADISFYPTFFVSKIARKDVTVVLTGDGGDELFGGYTRYFKQYESNRQSPVVVSNLIKTLNKKACDVLYDLIPEYLYGESLDYFKLRRRMGIPLDYDDAWCYRKYYEKDLPPITRMRYMDFMTYLPNDILTKVDRMSMLNSLEARVPLLDKDIVEFAFSLSQKECNPDNKSKGLFRLAYSQEIPDEMFERNKAGFMMPHRFMKSYGNITKKICNDYSKNSCLIII